MNPALFQEGFERYNHYYLDFNFKSVSHHFSNYSSVLFISFHFVLEIKIPHQIVLFLLIYFPLYIFFSCFNLMYFLNLYHSLRFTSRFTSVYMNTQGTSLSSSSSSSSSPWQSFRKFFAGLVFAAWLRIYIWPFLDNKERTWGRKINFLELLKKYKKKSRFVIIILSKNYTSSMRSFFLFSFNWMYLFLIFIIVWDFLVFFLKVSTSRQGASTLSPSSSMTSRWKYDVFLSFSGVDTRRSFTDHLLAALKWKGILTFKDDEGLDRGKSILSELLKAIEESRFAIIIFSKNLQRSLDVIKRKDWQFYRFFMMCIHLMYENRKELLDKLLINTKIMRT